MRFPTEAEFKLFIEQERERQFTSSNRSNFRYIAHYFESREFNKQNVLQLKQELLAQRKQSTVKKYIEIIKLIGLYMGVSFTQELVCRVREEAEPMGELISDLEMKKIAECDLFRFKRSQEETEEINMKYKTALSLMRYTGIPPIDLCNLTWNHDKFTHFEIQRAKTGKRMIIPIVESVRTLLDKLPRHNDYVFGSKQGRMKPSTLNFEIKKRCEYLGIHKNITCYSFRHSMITWCYIEGGEGMLPKLSKITGHDMNTAVKHYTHFDVKVLTDALYATHPGLKQTQSIDTIKRVVVNLLSSLIDTSKYQIHLSITPKEKNKVEIHLS